MANKINIKNYSDPKEFLTPIQYQLIQILEIGSLKRRDLVQLLNSPRTTVYDNLIKLHKRKVVEKFTKNNGKRGRPVVFWKLKN